MGQPKQVSEYLIIIIIVCLVFNCAFVTVGKAQVLIITLTMAELYLAALLLCM